MTEKMTLEGLKATLEKRIKDIEQRPIEQIKIASFIELFCKYCSDNPYVCCTELGFQSLFYSLFKDAFKEAKTRGIDGIQGEVLRMQIDYRAYANLGLSISECADISILQKEYDKDADPHHYDYQKLVAAIEFEMNESAEHFFHDLAKLTHEDANIDKGYILHLSRQGNISARDKASDGAEEAGKFAKALYEIAKQGDENEIMSEAILTGFLDALKSIKANEIERKQEERKRENQQLEIFERKAIIEADMYPTERLKNEIKEMKVHSENLRQEIRELRIQIIWLEKLINKTEEVKSFEKLKEEIGKLKGANTECNTREITIAVCGNNLSSKEEEENYKIFTLKLPVWN